MANETTTKFKVDIAELKKNFQEASRQIRLANSEFKAASSGLDNWSKSADGVSAKINQLNKILTAQKSQLKSLESQYALVVKQEGKTSKGAQELLIKINNQKAAIGNTEKQIRTYNVKLDEMEQAAKDAADQQNHIKSEMEKLNDTISDQEDELKKLKKQYQNVVLEQGEGSDTAKDLGRQIENLSSELKQNRDKLNDAENAADEFDKTLDKVDDSSSKATDGFTIMKGALANLVAEGIKLAIQGFKDLASAAKDAYGEFDDGYDNLIKATGATGETAKDLEKSYKKVAKSIKGEFGNIGSAVGEVNTRFGYTGEQLEDTTVAFMKFANITGTDATQAVQLVSRAMGDAGIDSSKYAEVLDELAIAAQASGISIDTLTGYLTKYGAPMRALGFDTKESIAIFSQWEKAGVNTEIAFSGMKNAISKWSSEGKDAKKEFRKTLDEIAATPDIASATTKAIDVFGKKAGPDLADAIKGGRFEYSEFLKILEGSEGTVNKTYEQTQDGFDKVALAIQSAKADLGAFMKEFLDKYGPQIEKAIEKIRDTLKKMWPKIEKALDWVIKHLPEIEAGIVGIGVAFAAWKIAGIIVPVITALKAMSAAEALAAAKTWLLNTALAANPIGLIVAAIAGLVAAFIVLWKRSDKFRNFWIGLWDTIKNKVIPFLETLVEYFKLAWKKIKPIVIAMGKFLIKVIKEIVVMFKAAWGAIKAVWDLVKPYFEMIWKNIKTIFSVVVKVLGGYFKAAWAVIKLVWDVAVKYFTLIWNNIKTVFSAVKNTLGAYFKAAWEAIKFVWNTVVGYFKMIWNNIKAIFSVVKKVLSGDFKGAWDEIKKIWNNVTGYFQGVWNGIKRVFASVANFFETAFGEAWKAIKGVFSNVGEFFGGIWDTIKTKFTDIGTKVGDAVGGAFKAVINGALELVENTINAGIKLINKAIGIINKIPKVDIGNVPEVQFGRLAKGGVVNKPMFAEIGEDGKEAVVPLENNTGWLDEIANRLSDKLDRRSSSRHDNKQTTTVNNNFYQTNNSPKSLSRLEIYRQSKNLLRMKGV